MGYKSEVILNKAKVSVRKVIDGSYAYERDTVLFNKIEYSWPVTTGLMASAALSEGELNVLDFGGSLGSHFFQNRCFLELLHKTTWNIVEQPSFVKIGKKLKIDNLNFYNSIEKAYSAHKINTVLMSGSLQYIRHPYDTLRQVLSHNPSMIIIDRLASSKGPDQVVIQNVPRYIYGQKVTYPCTIFNKDSIPNLLEKNYFLLEKFETYVSNNQKLKNGLKVTDIGFIFIKKTI